MIQPSIWRSLQRFHKLAIPRLLEVRAPAFQSALAARAHDCRPLFLNRIEISSRKFHCSSNKMAAASDRDILPDAYEMSPAKDLVAVLSV